MDVQSLEHREMSVSDQIRELVVSDWLFIASVLVKLMVVLYMLLLVPIATLELLSIDQQTIFTVSLLLLGAELVMSIYQSRVFMQVCNIVTVDYQDEYKSHLRWYSKLGVLVGIVFGLFALFTGQNNTIFVVAAYIVVWCVSDPFQQSVTTRFESAVDSVSS